ncbi:Transcription factor vrtR1 [Fusarium oxysporum f. sp. albedinis]|nr:Transcription factor vrtR1 [Fusarium oxysporum f. sp. albedinis]
MYQRPNQGAKWSYNPEELPQAFESGYSHLFHLLCKGTNGGNSTNVRDKRESQTSECYIENLYWFTLD